MDRNTRFLVCILLFSLLPGCGAGCSSTGVHHGDHTDAGTPGETMDSTVETPPPTPGIGETCDNGLDDNGDGLIDEGCTCGTVGGHQACWPGASGRRGMGICRDGSMPCVANGEFAIWGDCVGAVMPAEEISGNGIDEDCDGSDPGGPGCAEFETCDNGIDDDCDGLADCADTDCPACTTCTPNEFRCTDGADDDCDGAYDCTDPDCTSDPSCAPPPPPPPPGCVREFPFFVEIGCTDGNDNDCDGHVDCDDTDCHHPGSCGCAGSETSCTDSVDEDCDGTTDCADMDCNHCVPGAHRWCDDPTYCHWGRQECAPDGHWGVCTETTDRPPGCMTSSAIYSASCCEMAGECCQDYPMTSSIGNCASIETCH